MGIGGGAWLARRRRHIHRIFRQNTFRQVKRKSTAERLARGYEKEDKGLSADQRPMKRRRLTDKFQEGLEGSSSGQNTVNSRLLTVGEAVVGGWLARSRHPRKEGSNEARRKRMSDASSRQSEEERCYVRGSSGQHARRRNKLFWGMGQCCY
ncbi:hypothetical protein BJX68DRAFT_156499 [Aspergillus pseudodeflectus]|uniref:Uncharacterized protein n=1 Tax=Aspergillus pseudodeflectus TaxID=176178 RepID=A0ABR4JT46_9EURO